MNFKNNLLLCVFLFVAQNSFSALYGGIEIGSKGIKVSIVEMTSVKKGDYKLIEYWVDNVGLAKGISTDGNMMQENIEITGYIVMKDYLKLLNVFKIENKNIYIVASSGIGMAKNTDVLIAKIKENTEKELEIITANLEGKLLLKGCIPPKFYMDSMVLDIGGGNTKGGYIQIHNVENQVFFPLVLNLGTITLTDKIKKIEKEIESSSFSEISAQYSGILKSDFSRMYSDREFALEKKNVYMSGGATWAFYTLFHEKEATANYNSFTIKEVKDYNEILTKNFEKLELLAITNPDVDKVLKTYSKEHLMSANILLMSSLENFDKPEEKNLFFAKQGQIAWLIGYIVDSAKFGKVIY